MRGMAQEKAPKVNVTATSERSYTWQRIYDLVVRHKKELFKANVIAFFAMLATVPLPLLLPILVDEVLLDQPGPIVAFLQNFVSPDWYTATYYIVAITVITIILRLAGLGFGVGFEQSIPENRHLPRPVELVLLVPFVEFHDLKIAVWNQRVRLRAIALERE